jgi:hypothetical protein
MNVFINNSLSDYVGIFVSGLSCTVSNIHLKNITFIGNSRVGALFGTISSSNLNNLTIESVTGYGKNGKQKNRNKSKLI